MKLTIAPEGPQRAPASRSAVRFGAGALLAALVLSSCVAEDPTAQEVQTGAREAGTESLSNAGAKAPSLAELTAEEPTASAADVTPVANSDAATPALDPEEAPMTEDATPAPTTQVATLGAGCFWCIEAVLEQVEGIESVVSGYTGGDTLNPTYQDICTGQTGHAEVVKVTFNPAVISYEDLLDWFWRAHDPTTLNRQGPDRGTQYRSAIYVHSAEQRAAATASLKAAQASFRDPIVTEITDAPTFYPAETYHQGYYQDNRSAGYCRRIIAPKLKKLDLDQ